MSKQITVVLGTKNPHKVREILAIYKLWNSPKIKVKFIPLSKYTDGPSVPENGTTYMANALKKAISWARHTGFPTLAEDSGLEVKALKWQPGIYSARYASIGNNKNALYKSNNQKLLAKLKGRTLSERIARYRCSAILVSPTGEIIARSDGTCWGRIALKGKGDHGFGYDPVFIPKLKFQNCKYGSGRTFGQLPARLKHHISHRGIALKKIFNKILQFLDMP